MTGLALLTCNAPRDPKLGMPSTMLGLGNQLERRGWQVEYVFGPDRPGRRARIDRQLMYGRVVAAARRIHPDVAVISSGDGALMPALAPRVPFIMLSHGLEQQRREEAERSGVGNELFGRGHRFVREPAVRHAARHATAVATPTSREATYLSQRLGVASERIAIVPYGTEAFFFDVERAPADEPTILWIGRWTRDKGADRLPTIIDRLLDVVPTARVHLVGTILPARDVVEAFTERTRPRVTVTPRATREEVARAIGSAWVGLANSRFEGFGRAVIEMMAGGLPVVATRVGVANEIVVDEETGHLFDACDVDTPVEVLARLLGDRSSCARLGENARVAALPFQWDRVGATFEAVVRGAAGGSRP